MEIEWKSGLFITMKYYVGNTIDYYKFIIMKSLDLLKIVYYHSFREGNQVPFSTPRCHLRFAI